MDTLIVLLTPLEMLLTNLFVIDRCSQRKYSNAVTYLFMSLFTIIIVGCSYIALSQMPEFGSGNGLFVFLGFLFAFPVKILYKTSFAKIVCLACSSWVYTFFLFSISVHVSFMIPDISRNVATLAVQTILYLISFVPLFRLVRYKLLPMLSQLSVKETRSLMWMSIVWFWTIYVINLAFVYPEIYVLRVVAVVSTGVCALNFYRYIYHVINSDRTIESLEKLAYHDALTQLRGRALLASDANQLIERNMSFTIVFMDLNNFKSINDNYGHVMGDEYLSFFAQEVKTRIGEDGGFYRLAGDEFVGLLTVEEISGFLASLHTLPPKIQTGDIPFLGVSYGIAQYPVDALTLNDLLDIADKRMYHMKKAAIES